VDGRGLAADVVDQIEMLLDDRAAQSISLAGLFPFPGDLCRKQPSAAPAWCPAPSLID